MWLQQVCLSDYNIREGVNGKVVERMVLPTIGVLSLDKGIENGVVYVCIGIVKL
jgi:hypothetical protein